MIRFILSGLMLSGIWLLVVVRLVKVVRIVMWSVIGSVWLMCCIWFILNGILLTCNVMSSVCSSWVHGRSCGGFLLI